MLIKHQVKSSVDYGKRFVAIYSVQWFNQYSMHIQHSMLDSIFNETFEEQRAKMPKLTVWVFFHLCPKAAEVADFFYMWPNIAEKISVLYFFWLVCFWLPRINICKKLHFLRWRYLIVHSTYRSSLKRRENSTVPAKLKNNTYTYPCGMMAEYSKYLVKRVLLWPSVKIQHFTNTWVSFFRHLLHIFSYLLRHQTTAKPRCRPHFSEDYSLVTESAVSTVFNFEFYR